MSDVFNSRSLANYPKDIVDRVVADFDADAIGYVHGLLEQLKSDRLARCALFLARGSLEKLKQQVDLGTTDFRDLIVAAEYDLNDHQLRDFNQPFGAEASKIFAVTLFRPVGPKELALIEESGWRAFPPRLPDQPIFYPVTNEGYAIEIARDWNVKASGSGYVTRFQIDAQYVARFPKKVVGRREHEELWVPAEELPEFNSKIVGKIEVIRSFPEDQRPP